MIAAGVATVRGNKTKTIMATGNAAGFIIAAEIDANILLEEEENIVAAEYAILRHLVEEREEERPQNPVRVRNYAEVTVPLYSQDEFQKHFRMHRETVEDLCRLLAPHMTSRTITINKKVLATLWLLGNIESFRGVGDRFDLSKSSLHYTVIEVCDALMAIRPDYIVWPTVNKMPQLADEFKIKSNMPGVIGAIDGTHIPIPGPTLYRASYINRKGFPSMQLQAVCDSNLRFLNTHTGWPGSVHDARVFRNCELHTLLENGNIPSQYHLLGDSAYALEKYMIVPYMDNGHLLPWQTYFNYVHASTRVVIERAFGLLKGKFRRLKKLEMHSIDKIPLIITGACVLHNFILIKENPDINVELQEFNMEPQDVEGVNTEPRPQDVKGEAEPRHQQRAAAVAKRDQLALQLARLM